MKMKKMIYCLFVLMLLSTNSMNAQVAIGSESNPRPGAILDLQGGGTTGLLLPKVTLQSATLWAPVVGEKKDEIEGMMVFNDSPSTENGLDGIGVYVWVDGSWNKMGAITPPACSVPDTPGAITGSTTVSAGTDDLIYEAEEVTYATSYTWQVPEGWSITAGNGTKSITVSTGEDAVSGNITVKANSDCGSSSAGTIAVTVICQGAIVVAGAYTNVAPQPGLDGPFNADWTGGFGQAVGNLCWGKYVMFEPLTWDDANAACPGGWRLPNLAEFQKMYLAWGGNGEYTEVITPDGMDNFELGLHWTGTEGTTGRAYAFSLNAFSTGGYRGWIIKTTKYNYRCVRLE